MTDAEQREAARQFVNRWMGKGKEDEDGRSYWIDLLTNVLGMDNVTERLNFEKKVVIDGNTKRIDVYIPETRVIIEQKSLGKALDQKIRNSGDVDLTPFEQADRYNGKLTFDERARWIVTSNFAEIWIYDMNEKQPEPTKIMLEELQTKYSLLDFLIEKEVQKISHEMEVSIKAGDIVGLLYNAFLEQYKIPEEKKNETEVEKEKREHKLKSLNALCVRLVFCLYAEDAGIFGEKRNMFHDYLARYEARDCRRALIELFKVLDTEEEDREDYLEEELAQFPYVNGGLFADESVEIPQFTEEIRELLLTKASEEFNWKDISPTIFGAVFESTLNPETRRHGGMHYTSVENIHKVIDPLFMDELEGEFETIQTYKTLNVKRKKLMDFQEKLAHLKFLDPACGSGNFLTETYLSLRRLENKVLRVLYGEGQGVLGVAASDIIKVSIQQFYGIEINDFAVTVAKTALWIAESQMLDETKNIIYGLDGDFLPLKTYVNITEGNALRIDWNDVISADELNLAENAKSAIMIEATTGEILYKKNEKERLAPASMTKIMSLILIMENIESGKLKWNDIVVTSNYASSMGGSQVFLKPNEIMSVEDLVKAICVASANDATVAMAEKIAGTEKAFVKLMNDKSKELGAVNTNFVNSTGLPAKDHYSTAYDMSIMAKELIRHEKILSFTKIYEDYLRKNTSNSFWLVNTNKVVFKFYYTNNYSRT